MELRRNRDSFKNSGMNYCKVDIVVLTNRYLFGHKSIHKEVQVCNEPVRIFNQLFIMLVKEAENSHGCEMNHFPMESPLWLKN